MKTVTQNRRILLIDDNPAIHEDFRKILTPAAADQSEYLDEKALLFGTRKVEIARPEFEIDSAFQGQEGLDLVERSMKEGRPYALAFVDVRMPPGWDGVETIERIWKNYPDLQVVICTAYSDYSWDEMMRRLGQSDNLLILKKPFDNVEVLQLANALTKKWNVTLEASARINNLDQLVQVRTEELQKSEERFLKAFRNNPLPMFIQSAADERFIEVNDSFLKLSGHARSEVVGHTPQDLSLWVASEGQDRIEDVMRNVPSIRQLQALLHTGSGEQRTTFLYAESFVVNEEPCRLVLIEDITQRLKLESDLRQAQKMEAVGQLAAGVAHDFNNILTIVQGHISLALARNHLEERTTHALNQALTASERAGNLTRQLLAFSRKQVMQRKPLHLSSLLEQIGAMLHRVIGEQVTMEFTCAPDLPPIFADRCNMENAIINLALNARDAMPQGGRIDISAKAVHVDREQARAKGGEEASSGRFVRLSVTDTGCGMSSETKQHLFEPFFTTKGVGKGTGMGLASVYGIVKQHQGWIDVETELGKGTSFHAYLPECLDIETGSSATLVHSSVVNASGTETILVVEDEDLLLEFVQEVLESNGYRILTATNAVEAMDVWHQNANEISLVLTDMVMPGGVTGKELAAKLTADKTDLRIIFTSGYSLEVLGMDLQEGVALLQKPYRIPAMLKMVRDCLDGAAQPSLGRPDAIIA